MSLSNKGSQTDTKLGTPSRATALNPNAAEFVPFSLRTLSSGSTSSVDATRLTTAGTLGKAVLDRTESSISNNSDDEAHQYWRCQLPDDITPDFKVMGEDIESPGLNNLSLAGLSIEDDNESPSFPSSKGSRYLLNEQQELSQKHLNGNAFADTLRFSSSTYREEPSSGSFLSTLAKPWDRQVGNANLHVSSGQEELAYDDNITHGLLNDVLGENATMVDDTGFNPLEFLASLFPGFASESLAEVYFANGCDFHLTIEMLTQLEIQVDGGFSQNPSPKTLSAPNLTAMDFPALSSPNGQATSARYVADNVQQSNNPYLSSNKDLLMFKSSSSVPSRGAVDFASAVRKLASQDSGIWKYDRNGSGDASTGSSRSLNVLASAYNGGQGRANIGDRLQNRSSARAAPAWVETGEAVANMYSDLREEARDHARLRNAYFEQVGL
ncbi:polyadenylate-binding protein-interacting protein 7 isoform X2 [Lotus japonicus]|uniref:polyadenylate-binding protein-interacting protein 7 isoform X2 n=1 Tax=Lotus japonicus TaxID=34305 RepID=UPI002587DAAA|nr:polyadenylate-binding protein-interacting protein 7 isoform X2 [Lotus japonicus]